MAVTVGNVENVVLLLDRSDVDPNINDASSVSGATPLISAIYREGPSSTDIIKVLLSRSDVDPNKPDMEGQTPLYMAALLGHRDCIATPRKVRY